MESFTGAVAFLVKGGPIMVPLLAASFLAVAVTIERAVILARASRDSGPLMRRVREALQRGAFDEAVRACEEANTPVGRVLAAGLRARHLPPERLEKVLEEEALSELPALNRRLVVLDTVITIAPLLGLLGTVTGMIRSFGIMAVSGIDRPHGITGGVAEALIATAVGLAIAITTLIAYNWFTEKVRDITSQMEIRATQLINLLAEARAEPWSGRPGTDGPCYARDARVEAAE
ncbi:MAG TPA: MotA/TolQ/ExbB proton channel family protein [Armatimonadota bacterium]|nr:MotA/TolQ/ExbB proton channel family protein [Armatimonadota bacterium]HOJ22077.1 MotA/TolQ/ExbB proton channel family protein [Armatimonadota bacterium]HOM81130.1 MotA/TolQ/ExbB proton channel family protein [Armatimonadota bacterium]HPO72509.1 MotA/TolQ/ExbB proton channel family protein [Armatimonadota bacterium]HPT97690.1 MotA/TolQ/ExbB proton channel family protein [Armatimonadota bacterium]